MEQITLHVIFDVKEGMESNFEELTLEFVARTSPEPDTLSYNFYVTNGGKRFVSVEIYANFDALSHHQAGNKDLRDRAGELTNSITVEILGATSEAVRKLMGPGEYFDWFDGIRSRA